MTHNALPKPDDITGALWDRIGEVSKLEGDGLRYIRHFGIFIDTHRDQPHVGSFGTDIHRGQCRPTWVDYCLDYDVYVTDGLTYNAAGLNGAMLQRHPKHMFIAPQWLADYDVNRLMNGQPARDQDGYMPTSHLRDARAKRYFLWSFRQVVMTHWHNVP